jgi:hypothetical protein
LIEERAGHLRTALRLTPKIVLALLFVAVPLTMGAQPAQAAVTGQLKVLLGTAPTTYGECLAPLNTNDVYTFPCHGGVSQKWELTVVNYVNHQPRYSIRNPWINECLVAFASSGDVGTYTCNSNWADQVWALQYVRDDANGHPLFWIRNKHSGRCLVANHQRWPDVFMHTCANYSDQLFYHP